MVRETKVRCEQCNKLTDEAIPGAVGPKGLPKGWVEVTLGLNGAPGSVHAEVCSEGCAKNYINKAIIDYFERESDVAAEPGWGDSTGLPRNT